MPSFLSTLLFLLLSTTVYAQCTSITIDGPSVRTVTRNNFLITGSIPPDCTDNLLQLFTDIGEVQWIFADAAGRFSAPVGNQPFGTKDYYMVYRSDPAHTIKSKVITANVICDTPSIDQPYGDPNSPNYDPSAPVLNENRPSISGHTNCPFVTIEILGEPSVTVDVNESGEYATRSQPLSNGPHAITVVAASDRLGSNSARSETKNVAINSAETLEACHAPLITNYADGQNAVATLSISGLIDVGSACDTGLVRVVNRDTGVSWQAPTDGSGRFNVQLGKQALGLQHYYVVHSSDTTTEAYRSNVIGLSIICGAPIIQRPSNDINDPGYNPNADVQLDTSRPIISGYSDCPFVTLQIPGEQSIALATDSSGGFFAQWGQLRNGRHTVTVIGAGDQQGSYSARSQERNFYINSADPFPTAGMERRASLGRNKCRKNEDMCRFEGIGGQRVIGYECVSDLSSNIELCGSCDGPDCTMLPFVDGVSCQRGQCIVQSCQHGYTLVGNQCL